MDERPEVLLEVRDEGVVREVVVDEQGRADLGESSGEQKGVVKQCHCLQEQLQRFNMGKLAKFNSITTFPESTLSIEFMILKIEVVNMFSPKNMPMCLNPVKVFYLFSLFHGQISVNIRQ